MHFRGSGLQQGLVACLGLTNKPRLSLEGLTLMTPPRPYWGSLVGTPVSICTAKRSIAKRLKAPVILGWPRNKAVLRTSDVSCCSFFVRVKHATVSRSCCKGDFAHVNLLLVFCRRQVDSIAQRRPARTILLNPSESCSCGVHEDVES